MTTCLKLAITKIGDLLLDGKITQDMDGNPINGINLAIPNYQRPINGQQKMQFNCSTTLLMLKTKIKKPTE